MSDVFTLGGQQYRPIKCSTIEHDFWLMDRVRAAGLDAIALQDDETHEQFAERLLQTIIVSGTAFELLGGFLLRHPHGDLDWSPAMATDTANALRKITAPEEKAVIRGIIVGMLLDFFAAGLIVLSSSQKSSIGPNPSEN